MIDLSIAPNWFYTVQTKTGREREAAANLESQGAFVFAPFVKNTRYFTRNAKYRTLPAFPRYIFAAFTLEDFYARFRNTRGVSGLVRFGDEFGRIEKETLQVVADHSPDDLLDWSYVDTSPIFRYAIGEMMRVTFGEWIDGIVTVAGHDHATGEYIVEPFVETSEGNFNSLNLTGLLKARKSERHLEPLAAAR